MLYIIYALSPIYIIYTLTHRGIWRQRTRRSVDINTWISKQNICSLTHIHTIYSHTQGHLETTHPTQVNTLYRVRAQPHPPLRIPCDVNATTWILTSNSCCTATCIHDGFHMCVDTQTHVCVMCVDTQTHVCVMCVDTQTHVCVMCVDTQTHMCVRRQGLCCTCSCTCMSLYVCVNICVRLGHHVLQHRHLYHLAHPYTRRDIHL